MIKLTYDETIYDINSDYHCDNDKDIITIRQKLSINPYLNHVDPIIQRTIDEYKELPQKIINLLVRVILLNNSTDILKIGYYFDINTNNTELVIMWYKRAASMYNITSMCNLGVIYESGHQNICEKNYEKAMYWYYQGYKYGHTSSTFHLGRMFYRKNKYKVAFRLFLKAAKKYHTMAMINVGTLYLKGLGISENFIEAHKWLMRGFLKNSAIAAYNLGILYYNGLGVCKDIDLAEQYFQQACDKKMNNSLDKKYLNYPKDLNISFICT